MIKYSLQLLKLWVKESCVKCIPVHTSVLKYCTDISSIFLPDDSITTPPSHPISPFLLGTLPPLNRSSLPQVP